MKSRIVRILLADDNPALRSALALVLETRLKARVVGKSYSMEDLLVKLPSLRPDVIILDWELPGLPKTERVALLRKALPSLKIVITSSRPEVAQQARNVHADAYVCKCEPPEQLVRALQAI